MLSCLFNATAVVGDWLALWQRVKPSWNAGYGLTAKRVPSVTLPSSDIFQSYRREKEEPVPNVAGDPDVSCEFLPTPAPVGPAWSGLWSCLQAPDESGYRVSLVPLGVAGEEYKVILELAVNGLYSPLATTTVKVENGVLTTLRLHPEAGVVKVEVAGVTVISHADKTYTKGRGGIEGTGVGWSGLVNFAQAGVVLDDLKRVEAPLNSAGGFAWRDLPIAAPHEGAGGKDKGECVGANGWVPTTEEVAGVLGGRSGAFWEEEELLPDSKWATLGEHAGRGLVSDGTYLYWTEEVLEAGKRVEAWIGRMLLDGSGKEPHWTLAWKAAEAGEEWYPQTLAINSTHLFFWMWQNPGNAKRIERVKLDGTGLETILTFAEEGGSGLTVTDTRLWYEASGHWLGRANPDGSGNELHWLKSTEGALGTVGNDGIYLYFQSHEGVPATIARVKLDGTGLEEGWMTGTESEPLVNGPIVARGSYLYWPATSIGRVSTSGGGRRLHWLLLSSEAYELALDATYVYWTREAAGVVYIGRALLEKEGTKEEAVPSVDIERVASTGAEYNPAWLTDPPFAHHALAVGGSHLYWVTLPPEGGPRLGRIGLDHTGIEENWWNHYAINYSLAPNAIAGDSNYVYFAANVSEGFGATQIARRSTAEGAPVAAFDTLVEFVAGKGQPMSIAIGGGYLFWITNDAHMHVGRWKLDGSEEPNFSWIVLASPPHDQVGLVCDGTYVYFSGVGVEEKCLGRVLIDGTGLEEEWLPPNSQISGPLAVDASYIYWGHDGFIGRVSHLGAGVLPKWAPAPSADAKSEGLATAPLPGGEGEWELRLEKRLGGQSLMASVLVGTPGGGWHELAFDISPSGVITVLLDGVTVITVTNDELTGGYVGLEGSPINTIGERKFTMDAVVLDPLEREEDPLSNGGKWTKLPWDADIGHDRGASGWQPSSTTSGAYWNAQWFGALEPPAPPPAPEPEGTPEPPITATPGAASVVPFSLKR